MDPVYRARAHRYETLQRPPQRLRRWATEYYFGFRIEHHDGLRLIDADHCELDRLHNSGEMRFMQFQRMYAGRFIRL
jgi:hypothetical protein